MSERAEPQRAGLFESQMAMYTSYHRDSRNRATHFIGIPAIIANQGTRESDGADLINGLLGFGAISAPSLNPEP